MRHATRVFTGLETHRQRVWNDVESRAQRFLSALEKEAQTRLNPLLKQLDFASLHEVHRLSRRVAQLERRLRSDRSAESAAAPPETARAASSTQMTSLQRYAELLWDEV